MMRSTGFMISKIGIFMIYAPCLQLELSTPCLMPDLQEPEQWLSVFVCERTLRAQRRGEAVNKAAAVATICFPVNIVVD